MFRWITVFILLLSFLLSGFVVNPSHAFMNTEPTLHASHTVMIYSPFSEDDEATSTTPIETSETSCDELEAVVTVLVLLDPENIQTYTTHYSKPILSEFVKSLDWPPSVRA